MPEALPVRYRRADAYGKRDAAYFHPIEAASPAEIRALQNKGLIRQLAYLKARSPFYQRKFAEAGATFADIRSLDDLHKAPFTVKDELRQSLKAAPPFGAHQAAARDDIIQMQASSGTTGSPSYVALTERDVWAWNEMSARGFFAGGIRPGDLVLHGFSLSKGFVGGVPIVSALQYMGAIDIPVGADGGIDRLLVAARDLRPRAIVGTPNFLLYLAGQARASIGGDARELGVERLIVGGEPGGGIPSLRAQLHNAWGAKVTELMGGTDLGVIYWGECDAQDGMHFQCPDHIIVELIDPESGRPIEIKQDAVGELVYTAIGRQASPVFRFRSGDHVVVTGTSCGCGRTGFKIRCFGRTDDMLIVRGVNVFPSAIQDIVVAMQPRTNGVMRVLADFEGHTTQANLKLFVERGFGQDPGGDGPLARDIEARLRNTLSFKADVAIVPPETFEKPGVKKVTLTLRRWPENVQRRS